MRMALQLVDGIHDRDTLPQANLGTNGYGPSERGTSNTSCIFLLRVWDFAPARLQLEKHPDSKGRVSALLCAVIGETTCGRLYRPTA